MQSHYNNSSPYDDLSLKLPPIRTSDPSSSSTRPHTSSRYVPPLEPPPYTSSSNVYPRNAGVNLPPLRSTTRRPSTSHGYSQHLPTSPPPLQPARHPPPHVSYSSQSSYQPSPYQSSSSSHERPSSLSINTSNHYVHNHTHSTTHRSEHHSDYDAVSPTSSSRSYMCDLCGATFSRAYDCKRHREIHTRQGGHECPFCNKALSRADALKRHMERGCAGMDDTENLAENERERKDRKDKRHTSGEGGRPKYYYTSVNTRHH